MKTTYRLFTKVLLDIYQSIAECESNDNEMDGSGECGGFIATYWDKVFAGKVNELCAKYGIALTDFIAWLRASVIEEYKHSPIDTDHSYLLMGLLLNNILNPKVTMAI